jgi:hypothetical protein
VVPCSAGGDGVRQSPDRLSAELRHSFIHAKPTRSIFSTALNFRRSAIASFVRSPLRSNVSGIRSKMMDVSRHGSVDTLRGYVRDAEIFEDHTGAGLL